MIKKIIGLVFSLLIFGLVAVPVKAEESVNIHLFYSKTCPHCVEEKAFLEALEKKDSLIKIYLYEVTTSRENQVLLQKVGKELQVDISYVPFTVIGDEYFPGYLDEATTGKEIVELAKNAKEQGCRDVVGELAGLEQGVGQEPGEGESCETSEEDKKSIPEEVDLPLFGKVKLRTLSLPLLTFVLALSDGFNPCAMWVLLFLISLLLGMKNTAKMWILGITFILTSGLVYFLIMAMWLNLFLFIGYQAWARVAIGVVALGAAFYMLRDYFTNKDGGCPITGDKKRQKVFEKLKTIATDERFLVAVLGIACLAFTVNVVEFFCSFGLPAIYTQALSLSSLPTWQYYSYLGVYVLIFMLDDIFVFSAAMITMQAVGIQTKYARYAHLVGGVILLGMGLLMLLKPEILMFG